MNYLSATWEFIKPSNVFKHKFTPQAKNLDVEGKKLLITGGSKGIGLNICIQLAQKGIAEICMLARNEKIMAEAIELIKQKSLKIRAEQGFGPLKIYAIRLDQADYASIRTAIDTLFTQNDGTYPNFDVVMLNAGVMMGGLDAKTGYNNCFQINHLGTFYFGTYLLNKIKETQNQYPKRLLISGSAGNLAADPNGIVFDDINLENPQHPRSSPHFLGQTFNFYIQSKLANLLHVRKLAQILDNQKIPITVHCIHPGCVESDIRGVRTDQCCEQLL